MMNGLNLTPQSELVMRRHGYSDRPDGLRPLPLGLSLGVTTALFAAYLLAPQEIFDRIPIFNPIKTVNVPIDKPPPVAIPEPAVEPHKPLETTVVVPTPPFTMPSNNTAKATIDRSANNDFIPGRVGKEIAFDPPAKVVPLPPVLTRAAVDPRFADRFQPDYPARMLRLEREGIARVRVLIGTDGRVRDIADAGSSDKAFFEATRDYARHNWIFKPATRDGKPYESWYTMTVTFKLSN